MDYSRLETLLRLLAIAPSRRAALRGVGVLALTPLLGSRSTEAKKRKHKKRRKPPVSPPPPSACLPTCAGKVCGDDGCGGVCGIACTGGSCQNGACLCPASTFLCGADCVDPTTDGRHCGACGAACQVGVTCAGSTCQCGVSCVPGDTCCIILQTEVCVCDLTNNAEGRFRVPGTCASTTTCPPDQQCKGPRCQACCPPGARCDTSTGTCVQQ